MQIATVEYQVATYNGVVIVVCNEDDEDSGIIARAKQVLRRRSGPLPLGYQHFQVVARKDAR